MDVEDCSKTFYATDNEISKQLIIRGVLGCVAGIIIKKYKLNEFLIFFI